MDSFTTLFSSLVSWVSRTGTLWTGLNFIGCSETVFRESTTLLRRGRKVPGVHGRTGVERLFNPKTALSVEGNTTGETRVRTVEGRSRWKRVDRRKPRKVRLYRITPKTLGEISYLGRPLTLLYSFVLFPISGSFFVLGPLGNLGLHWYTWVGTEEDCRVYRRGVSSSVSQESCESSPPPSLCRKVFSGRLQFFTSPRRDPQGKLRQSSGCSVHDTNKDEKSAPFTEICSLQERVLVSRSLTVSILNLPLDRKPTFTTFESNLREFVVPLHNGVYETFRSLRRSEFG